MKGEKGCGERTEVQEGKKYENGKEGEKGEKEEKGEELREEVKGG